MKYGVKQHSIEIQSTGVCSSIFTDHLSVTLYVLLQAPVSGITGGLSWGWDMQRGLSSTGCVLDWRRVQQKLMLGVGGRAGFQVALVNLQLLWM